MSNNPNAGTVGQCCKGDSRLNIDSKINFVRRELKEPGLIASDFFQTF